LLQSPLRALLFSPLSQPQYHSNYPAILSQHQSTVEAKPKANSRQANHIIVDWPPQSAPPPNLSCNGNSYPQTA
jgi:hypothetical protein